MRALLIVGSVVLCCLAGAPSANAQGTATWRRAPEPPPRLVPIRPELLEPIGPTKLEDLRIDSELSSRNQRPEAAQAAPDRGSPKRQCPMPVARPDTTRLERMPVARSDTTAAASAPMPVISGCENPLFR